MSAADKPYTVTTYDLIDRTAKPPTVKPGREYSRHTSENAARKAAMKAPRSCIMDGPKSIAVLTGPDGFTVVEAPAGPTSDLSPAQG